MELALSMLLTCFAPSASRQLLALRLHTRQKARLGACFLPKASAAVDGWVAPSIGSLYRNALGAEGAGYLSEALKVNTSLKELKCAAHHPYCIQIVFLPTSLVTRVLAFVVCKRAVQKRQRPASDACIDRSGD